MGYINGKIIGYDEFIKVGFTDGIVLSTILGDVDGITLELDVGTWLGSSDGSFDGYNNGMFEGILI